MSVIDYGEVTNSTQLYQLIRDLLDTYRENIIDADAKASGELLTAATYETKQWMLRWKGETLQLVLMLPEYWRWIEQGRPPTQQSQGGVLYPAILEWVKVKHVVPRPDPKTNKVPSVERQAYMITRKIHREGYFSPNHQGKHLLQNAIDHVDLVERFKTALVDQFNREIKVSLHEELSNIMKK